MTDEFLKLRAEVSKRFEDHEGGEYFCRIGFDICYAKMQPILEQRLNEIVKLNRKLNEQNRLETTRKKALRSLLFDEQ